jgi:CMP-N-acetylneuraminic acid synthetase
MSGTGRLKMIVAIIPARGGSKGIPRKNITTCAGKPLISWTIERALESELLDKIYVSTEDKEIARISRKFGSEVLKRPPELAEDTTLIVDVLKHHLENDIPNAKTIVLLQPTSPVRDEGLIDFCIEQYKNQTYDSVATGFDVLLSEYGSTMSRRQDMQGYFHDDGNCYVINKNLILQGKLFNENHLGIYYQDAQAEKEQSVEIDCLFDLWLCEQILLKREKEKCQPSMP